MSATVPAVFIPNSDYDRLKDIATAASKKNHPVSAFLLSEIRRARVFEPRPYGDPVAALNKWVTYRVDGRPCESQILKRPQDDDASHHLSVLSAVGAALLGIKVGDQMPYCDENGTHFVSCVSLDPPACGPMPARVPTKPDDHVDPAPEAA